MASSGNERNRTKVVELGMEVQVLAMRRMLDDDVEKQDLSRMATLTRQLHSVCQRCQDRDVEENRDHELILELSRQIASLAEGLKVQVTAA